MQRLRTVTSLDVSAVSGHHAMPAALLFYVVEYISRKFIVTSLSISRRPPKERICFPAGESFLSEQIPLGRIASSGEADRMLPNLSPLRSDDKIPLKSSDVSTFHKLSVDTTLSVEHCL